MVERHLEENTHSKDSLKSPNEGAPMDVLQSSNAPHAVEATAPEQNQFRV